MSKVMPQMPRYLSFLLGKGGNPYASNPIKAIIASALSDLISPAHTKLDKVSMMHIKLPKICKLCKFFHANFAPFQ